MNTKDSSSHNDPVISAPRGAWYREHDDGFELGSYTRQFLPGLLVTACTVWMIKMMVTFNPQSGPDAGNYFFIPFSLGGILISFYQFFGTVRFRSGNGVLKYFIGIGPLGFSRSMPLNQIVKISHREKLESLSWARADSVYSLTWNEVEFKGRTLILMIKAKPQTGKRAGTFRPDR